MIKTRLNVVVIGESGVGKSRLVQRLTGTEVQEPFTIGYEDNHIDFTEGDKVYETLIRDTSSSELMRILSYQFPQMQPDVVILCFALDDQESYRSTIDAFYPEVKKYRGDSAVILVGTKTDKEVQITQEQREHLRMTVKPDIYLECSAEKGTGISALRHAIISAYKNKYKNLNKVNIGRECIVI